MCYDYILLDAAKKAIKMPSATRTTELYRIKVTIVGSKPLIWRRIEVSSDMTLAMLHSVLQTVMGWTNTHLNEFQTQDGRRYKSTNPSFDDGWCDDAMGAENIRLHDLKRELEEKIVYIYDFGDRWTHCVHLEHCQQALCEHGVAVCLSGKHACPPENCGGIWGYYDILRAIKDPTHESHQEMIEWLDPKFDPETFDIEHVNQLLQKLRTK